MQPWDRQPTEGEDAWAAFRRYRESTPPRKALRISGPEGRERVAKWFKENLWAERTAAYDNHLEGILLAERTAVLKMSAKDVATKHISMLHQMGDLATREVEKLLAASESSPAIGLLKPGEIIRMIDSTIKFDRLVRELPTEINEVKTNAADLSPLSPDDLRKLIELKKKMTPAEGT